LFIRIPRTIGVSIPMKATFFMTYIMVDGWSGIANEILRAKQLVIYHLKNVFLVKTERDRETAMDPGSIGLPENLPNLQLYFLLGLVYAVITPILLPFILIFFMFAFLVYRHQVSWILAFQSVLLFFFF
jgi:calcium permeable stress-gated cation channel